MDRERQEIAFRAICTEKGQKLTPFEDDRALKGSEIDPLLDKTSLKGSKIDPPE
jgi:hypothetical protein